MNWISIRFLLVLSEIAGLESKSIDFVLAFPQADLDVPVYMELPAGMQIEGAAHPKHHVLLLRKSLYGLKQASANWYDKLKRSLQLRGFHESVADPCVFVKDGDAFTSPSAGATVQKDSSNRNPRSGSCGNGSNIIEQFRNSSGGIIVLTYVDDCIILSRDRETITKFIATLKYGPEEFDFTDEGTISKYLGVDN